MRKKSREFTAGIISVGNITIGGAGKTPFVIELCNLIKHHDYKCSVVSRGYKGKYKDEYQFVSSENRILLSPDEAGDEPVLIAQKTGSTVVVARDRAKGIEALLKAVPSTEIIILDDAFSHIRVRRDIDIVLIDSWRNLKREKLIPFGTLREPTENIKRGDIFFANTRGRFFLENLEFLRELGIKNVYTFSYKREGLKNLKGLQFSPEEFFSMKLIAMAGIAHPLSFFNFLEETGIKPLIKIPLPDHFSYPSLAIKIIELIIKNNFFIIVTEKDAVKLNYLLPESMKEKIIYLETSLHIQKEGIKNILQMVKNVITNKNRGSNA